MKALFKMFRPGALAKPQVAYEGFGAFTPTTTTQDFSKYDSPPPNGRPRVKVIRRPKA